MNKYKKIIQNKYKILFLCFSILLIVVIFKESYAYFTATSQSIAQQVATGEIICDVTIDTNPNYIENNIAYFRVKVTNTKGGKTNPTPIKYQLTLQNEEGSNGIFYYIDSEGNTSSETGEYLSTITSQEYTFGTSEETREFKVYVKVPSGLKETVDFKIDINSEQI
ncbi:MAG TPA: hypothetical protein IAB56_05340 [Candidatus Scybalousia intestinigallinarum]|nr:hypothetical protein [Candidatus Scybalousia intestinigallinarum]